MTTESCYYLRRKPFKDHPYYVKLSYKKQGPGNPRIPLMYIQNHVQKPKTRLPPGPMLGTFLRELAERREERTIQYHEVEPLTCLTTRFYTPGLRLVGEGSVHKVVNRTRDVPLYLFYCRRNYERDYEDFCNKNLALVDKASIASVFEVTPVFTECVLTAGTVYFFYTVSHAAFKAEIVPAEPIPDELSWKITISVDGRDIDVPGYWMEGLTERDIAEEMSYGPAVHPLSRNQITMILFYREVARKDKILTKVADEVDDYQISQAERYHVELQDLHDGNASLIYDVAERDDRLSHLERRLKDLEDGKDLPGPRCPHEFQNGSDSRVRELERKLADARQWAAEADREMERVRQREVEYNETTSQMEARIRRLRAEIDELTDKLATFIENISDVRNDLSTYMGKS